MSKLSTESYDLRDMFAMCALTGFCMQADSEWSADDIATDAYTFADAMLRARKVQADDPDEGAP